MERVATTGRESLVELRRALGLLRESGPASHEPLPGLGRLEPLLGRARDSGLEIRHETTGIPRPLSPGVDLALYRVVQEALTNTVRHAGARRAVVAVDHGEHRVRVTVTDDGCGGAPSAAPGGSGLLGIRERVRVLGGEVEAGPLAAGGFRVAVSVPRGEHA
jgi:signal transduction histidine kinase